MNRADATIGRAPAYLADATDGDWIAFKRQSVSFETGSPVVTDVEIIGQINGMDRGQGFRAPHITATVTDRTGTKHQIRSAPNFHIEFVVELGAGADTDEFTGQPDNWNPDVIVTQEMGDETRPDGWQFYLGPDGYMWWNSPYARQGNPVNVEAWNRYYYGADWRTADPEFGPDDIDANQTDGEAPHEAELANINRHASEELARANAVAAAIKTARRARGWTVIQNDVDEATIQGVTTDGLTVVWAHNGEQTYTWGEFNEYGFTGR